MLLKVSEVAALLRLSTPTIRKMAELGTLRSVKLSRRGLRIPRESVEEYLAQLSSGAVKPTELSLQKPEV